MDDSTASIIGKISQIERLFTKDCYFYYTVPQEQLKPVADFFNDDNWKTYAELTSDNDRYCYRSRMCRSDLSEDEDSETPMINQPPPPGSEVCEDDDDIIGWNAVMSPWNACKFRTVKDINNIIWLIETFRYFIIVILLSVLINRVLRTA